MLIQRSTASSSPPVYISPRPASVRTLDDLRRWHRRLLHLSRATERDESLADEAAELTREGSALGSCLDLPRDREEAQAMLDYWAGMGALALAKNNKLSYGDSASTPSPVLEPFQEEDSRELVAAANRALDSLSAGQLETARRMLLRLTRLSSDGKSNVRAKVSRADLLGTANEPEASRTLQALLEAGVLREASAGDEDVATTDGNASAFIEISHDAMLRQWSRLHEWLDRRLKFRKAAEFWRDHDKDPGALFDDGPLLLEAESYQDLGDLEREFAVASRTRQSVAMARETELLRRENEIKTREADEERRASAKLRQWILVLGTLLVVMGGMLYALITQTTAKQAALEEAGIALSAADASRHKAEATAEELRLALKAAEEASSIARFSHEAAVSSQRTQVIPRSDPLKDRQAAEEIEKIDRRVQEAKKRVSQSFGIKF